MKKIIGIGNALVDISRSINTDEVLDNLKLPRGSMQLIGQNRLKEINNIFSNQDKKMSTGGSAANTISALSSLKTPAGFIGKIKKDEEGTFFESILKKRGVELKISYGNLPTGICTSFISKDGERTMATFLGSSSTMDENDLTEEFFKGYSYLYIEGYLVQNHKLIEKAITLGKKMGLKIAIDLASYNIVTAEYDFFTQLLKNVDIVFANEEESKAYTNCTPEKGVDEFAKICEIAVVKMGPSGVWVRRGTEKVFNPAVEVSKVIDTTGAGDIFAAGFLYALLNDAPLKDCALVGSLLAGEIIQIIGTNLPPTKWEEIKLKADKIINK